MSSRSPVRAVVLGLGPAGRIAAHRAAARGWDVVALDPSGGSMPSTVGAWAHQLPEWLPAEAVASRFRPTLITSTGKARELSDEYAILDTAVLSALDGFEVRREAGSPESAVRDLSDGHTDVVVIDTVARRGHLPARQLAYGSIFRAGDIPAEHRIPVLMDFTVPAGPGGPTVSPTSFSYRVPLGDGLWLIEETILVADVAGGAVGKRSDGAVGSSSTDVDRSPTVARMHARLRQAQAGRLAALGIDPAAAVDDEIVDFPVAPRRLPGPTAPGHAAFGAAGGWMHAATGYSVGSVLADVDRVLDLLEARRTVEPPGGPALTWLRRRGLHVLLGFDAAQTRTFFDAFLSLPDDAIREYLTGTSAPATTAVMARLALPLGTRAPGTLGRLLATFADGKPSGAR